MPATINGTTGFGGNLTGNVTGNVAGNLTGVLLSGGSLTYATSQASTSGTSIDFTGIPSWARRVIIIFNAVGTSGLDLRIRLGAGSVQTSGYNSRSTSGTTGWNATSGSSNGFDFATNGASQTIDGSVVLYNPAGNNWVASGVLASSLPSIIFVAGFITVSGTLDRIRLTTVNGTDTFDAGSVNIAYEG